MGCGSSLHREQQLVAAVTAASNGDDAKPQTQKAHRAHEIGISLEYLLQFAQRVPPTWTTGEVMQVCRACNTRHAHDAQTARNSFDVAMRCSQSSNLKVSRSKGGTQTAPASYIPTMWGAQLSLSATAGATNFHCWSKQSRNIWWEPFQAKSSFGWISLVGAA